MLGLRIYTFLVLMAQAFSAFKIDLITYDASLSSWTSKGSSVWDLRLRLLGREHRANGTLTIKEDIDKDHHTVAMETYNDASGSGNYKQMAFVVRQQSVCKAIAGFWFYLKASVPFGEKTDLPFENRTCPIPKGHYYIKDATVMPENWPTSMPRGYFKYVVTFRKDQEVVNIQEIVIHIVDRRD